MARGYKNRKWYKEWKQHGDKCHYCGKFIQSVDFTIDHAIPISRGGTNKRENLVACCKPCNLNKRGRTESEYAKLKKKAMIHLLELKGKGVSEIYLDEKIF